MRGSRKRFAWRLTFAAAVVGSVAGGASAAASPGGSAQPLPVGAPAAAPAAKGSFRLADGSSVTVGASGLAEVTDRHGVTRPFMTLPVQGNSAEGPLGPTQAQVARQLADTQRGPVAPDRVIVALRAATVTGAPVSPKQAATRAPQTSDPALNRALARVHAVSVTPLFGTMPAAQVGTLAQAAHARLGAGAVDLSRVEVVQVHGQDPVAAAAQLRAEPGVAFAEPDRFVDAMDAPSVPMPALPALSHPGAAAPSDKANVPSNYGVQSSLQSYLNANGVNAVGAYTRMESSYGQLPGHGETITNVSVGDLIDPSMARSGDDPYAETVGPTTVVQDGQRYLDLPSMPLIPTYTSTANGGLDPLGTTEQQDPNLAEVMLDFSVMAPLPHDQQRPDETGSAATDLLGIAPGAAYRLVIPSQPTSSQIAGAILAAATQNPRPDVINASLGFGSDSVGFPGRYLEDDPVQQAVIAAVVQHYGIVMTVSSNDGTRLVTPSAVGPDGGSTPTDTARRGEAPTTITDDYHSTTPTKVLDSGAIAVGGATTDDTNAVPPQAGGPLSKTGTFAETRISGATNFSSGFGTRVNVSAPSDAIASFIHPFVGPFGPAQAVIPVLEGGTSASAPMTAAAAAVVLQAARLHGKHLDPLQVRDLLERTGRAVPTPPQIDRPLNVGPQIDLSNAVDAVLSDGKPHVGTPTIERVSVAHRQELGFLGDSFVEATDPSAISLTGANGQDLFGPITFGADLSGLPPARGTTYRLKVGSTDFDATTPSVRITPSQLLTAAGQPIVSTTDRPISASFQILRGHNVVASRNLRVVLGPTDGSHGEALAPVVAPVIRPGHAVAVHYDLTGVTNLDHPQLVVSTAGHWSPAAAPSFHAGYKADLTSTSGTIELPANAFGTGGGIYGVGIVQNSSSPGGPAYGQFTPVRLDGASVSSRPDAPVLGAGTASPDAHEVDVLRSAPSFTVGYDVRHTPGAAKAVLEISAPAPTLYYTLSTFNNPNGTVRDNNGIDTGSTIYQPLPAAKGTATFDAVRLGLSTSLDYSLRIMPVDRRGRPVGQASPTSFLVLNDGLLPGQSTIEDFSVAGRDTVVSTHTWMGAGLVHDSALLRYDPTTGAYGSVLASDPQGGTLYETYGTDAAHDVTLIGRRGLIDHNALSTDQSLQTYDLRTNAKTSDASVEDSQFDLQTGRVDPTRHRGAILAWHYPDNTRKLIPFDLTTNTMQPPIAVDGPDAPTPYFMMDVDRATGDAVLASGNVSGDDCWRDDPGKLVTVNVDSRSVGSVGSTSTCVTGLAAGQDGSSSYLSTGGLVNVAHSAPDGTLLPVDEASAQAGQPIDVTATPSLLAPVIDPVHHVALVGSIVGDDLCFTFRCNGFNNNPMSSIAVVDLNTGKVLKKISTFHLWSMVLPSIHDDGFSTRHGIQIDPATRTGWTYGPQGRQLQQFSY